VRALDDDDDYYYYYDYDDEEEEELCTRIQDVLTSKFRLEHRLSRLRFFISFPNPSWQIPEDCLNYATSFAIHLLSSYQSTLNNIRGRVSKERPP
jgi:hypothetical protein